VGESGIIFPLASEMLVGRALTSDIMLPDDGVAVRHARLTLDEAGQVFVEDLDTSGGTFVNGERIPGRFAVVVYAGDRVRFGQAEEMRLDVPGARGGRAPGAASS
jgi:pSer/pThr/pTyr-binding forkhead associated (FHA) protein